jgi:hypothetical protein
MNRFTQKTFAVATVGMMVMCAFAVVWMLLGAFLGFNHGLAESMLGLTVIAMSITGISIIPATVSTFGMLLKDAKKLWNGD